MAHHHSYGRHISVNLNQADVGKALSGLAGIPRTQLKVTTAHVHATHRDSGRSKQTTTTILEVFRTIGNLPNLTTLTVDLSYLEVLPIVALTELLNGKSQLKSMHLSRTRLVAATIQGHTCSIAENLNNLKLALNGQNHLQILRLDSCRGNPLIMESLILEPPALTRIEVSGTVISLQSSPSNILASAAADGTVTSSASSFLAKLLQSSPHLQSLSLVNLPLGQISDAHILAMVAELSRGKRSSKVTELTLVSSLLARESGEAISNMLHLNESIESLTLHIDWEDFGPSVAKMLKANSKLRSFDFRVYGDEDIVMENVMEVAMALQGRKPDEEEYSQRPSSSLRRLRLCFELEPSHIPDAVLDAFSQALETNEKLGRLILTDTLDSCPLPVVLRTKLRLNRMGIPDLLRSTTNGDEIAATTTCTNVHAAMVEAIISVKDDIHVVYDLLSNYPLFCIAPLQQQQHKQPQNPSLIPSVGEKGDTQPYQLPTPKAGKSFGRKLKSLFARSA